MSSSRIQVRRPASQATVGSKCSLWVLYYTSAERDMELWKFGIPAKLTTTENADGVPKSPLGCLTPLLLNYKCSFMTLRYEEGVLLKYTEFCF